jgi:DNA-binding GntR family transcriptional regulator
MVSLGEQHTPLRTLVFDELRSRIVSGKLAPGSRLVEDQLAHELGVSRNPVREALRVLEAEGLIQRSPRRGAVVATVSPSEAAKVFEVREPLESLAACLAARKATEAEVAGLRELLGRMAEAMSTAPDALARLNTEFHAEVYRIAGSSYLAEVMETISWRMEWVFGQNGLVRGPASLDEHERIVDAIEAGDEALAARRAEEHVLTAQRAFEAAQPTS